MTITLDFSNALDLIVFLCRGRSDVHVFPHICSIEQAMLQKYELTHSNRHRTKILSKKMILLDAKIWLYVVLSKNLKLEGINKHCANM